VLHVIESSYLAEVIDPRSDGAVERGVAGELVLTNLGRWGSPLLRYRTGDVVQTGVDDGCQCGSYDLALHGGILGRTDDMLLVRGVNIHPSAVDDMLRASDGVVEYRVEIHKDRSLPELSIQVEPAREFANDPNLAQRLEAALTDAFGLRISVSLVPCGHLPRFEMKAERWVR
jgi:phenylacetate-CoA ligase